MITVGSLFSGIGGLDLGLEQAGMKTVWQVEQNAYCRKVLAKHWPDVPKFTDVNEVGKHNLTPVDLVAGGFPCQDVSTVGARQGIDGIKSGLWSEMFRIVGELRPRYVLVENVSALLDRGIERVLGNLAEIGYDAEWSLLSACSLGASHTRERLFVLAYPNRERLQAGRYERNGNDGEALCRGESAEYLYSPAIPTGSPEQTAFTAESGLAGVAYGVPNRVERNTAIGNAVAPPVAKWIGERIIEFDARQSREAGQSAEARKSDGRTSSILNL